MYGLIVKSDVTKSKYLEICKVVAIELKLPGLLPEGITEGGFKVIGGYYSKSPIENDGYFYKSVRHMRGDWPEIPKNVEEAWKDDDTILFKKDEVIVFYPKVSKKTENWTDLELETIIKVFDMKINKN